ncbi:hypothetical protein DL768_010486 [Monosporascus sp. mg162]|nr:hypothetical protein DL768_010486 [Monosporascus sp. mg162]
MLRGINVRGMYHNCSIAPRIASPMTPPKTDDSTANGGAGKPERVDRFIRNMSGPAFTDIIRELRSIAKVPVCVGADSISIDRVKMLDLIEAYSFVRTSVHRAWSHLPKPPVSEKNAWSPSSSPVSR